MPRKPPPLPSIVHPSTAIQMAAQRVIRRWSYLPPGQQHQDLVNPILALELALDDFVEYEAEQRLSNRHRFYSSKEAIGLLGVTAQTLREQRINGRFKLGIHYLIVNGPEAIKAHVVWNVWQIKALWTVDPLKRRLPKQKEPTT